MHYNKGGSENSTKVIGGTGGYSSPFNTLTDGIEEDLENNKQAISARKLRPSLQSLVIRRLLARMEMDDVALEQVYGNDSKLMETGLLQSPGAR